MENVLTALEIIGGVIAIITVAYLIKEKSWLSNERNLTGVRSLIQRKSDLENEPKFITDLEIKSVPCLRGLKWSEVTVLLDKKNIGLMELSNLRALGERGFLAVVDKKVLIPSRGYLIKKHFRNPLSYFVAIVFLLFAIFIVYAAFREYFNFVRYIIALAYLLFFEALVLHHFDDLLSLSLIKEGNCIGTEIFISEDFDSIVSNS